MQTSLNAQADKHNSAYDMAFKIVLQIMQDHFKANMDKYGPDSLFITNIDGDNLYQMYLNGFNQVDRQYHTCNCCKAFIRNYGALAFIDKDTGNLIPAFWVASGLIPSIYSKSMWGMANAVASAKVVAPFYTDTYVLGNATQAGGWDHFWVSDNRLLNNLCKMPGKTADQFMAQKKEDFKTMMLAMQAYKASSVANAVTILQTSNLYRSEKVLGPAEFLLAIHNAGKGNEATNKRWHMIANAPDGFLHPRSSMIGTLLDDIENGVDYDQAKSRFDAKMNPSVYQRPTAAPKAGTIDQAEKLVEQFGIARSLERRYATNADLMFMWKPTTEYKPTEGGVFGHLKKQEEPTLMISKGGRMTWNKFVRTILPLVKKIEVSVQSSVNYVGLLTATHADAPPILQWDSEINRNPVSWYMYTSGSTAFSWNMPGTGWVECEGITMLPSMWHGGMEHHGQSAILIMKNCYDKRTPSLCLFPEIMKSQYHGIRSVLEAHSRTKHPTGDVTQQAAGLRIDDSHPLAIMVTTDSGKIEILIDRWE
ncbi:hypothetical protein [Ralstonia phage RP13]|nr:hypothetical protein [Ralstonia phage RP13]